jgi:hypothetical protein
MQTSLLNTDPLAAVLDTWAFLFQMTAFMERPVLKQTLGDSYPVVAETLRNMDAEMERLVLLAAPTANVADLRRRIGAWAQAHPIRASLAGRQSADPDVIRKVGEPDLGAMASIEVLAQSVGDVTARLDSYNAYLPKQARWQAELLLGDVTREPQVSAALSNFVVLSNTAAKASSSMDRLPELVGQAREAVRADVEGQRLAAQAFLREERLQTLDALRQSVHGERLAATADLDREGRVVLGALRDQEVTVMNEIRTTSEKEIRDLDARGSGLIDRFFIRALELMLLTLVLSSLVAWALLRRLFPKPPDHAERLDRAA